jgi:WD40 repeat protein
MHHLGRWQLWNLAPFIRIGAPIKQIDEGRLVFSPDGKTLLGKLPEISGSSVQLWETSTARALGKPLVHRGSVRGFGFSPDGGAIFVTTTAQTGRAWSDGYVLSVWDTRSRTMKWWVAVGPGDRPAFSPDGKLIAWAGVGTMSIWDVDTGKPVRSLMKLPGAGQGLVTFSPDGKALRHEDGIWQQSFSPNGTYFETTIWRRGTVRLWDARSGMLLGEPLEPQNVYFRLFSADERTFVTGRNIELVTQEGGSVRMWDSATSKPIGPVIRFNDSVAALKLSPDGTLLLAASEAGELRFWKMPRPVEGEVKRIVSWVQVITEMQLDADGVMTRLDTQTWRERRRMLDTLGGPPS